MSTDQYAKALAVLTAAFPTYPIGDETAELYLREMAEHCTNLAVLYDAIMALVEGGDRFPTVGKLLGAYRDAFRQHELEERSREALEPATLTKAQARATANRGLAKARQALADAQPWVAPNGRKVTPGIRSALGGAVRRAVPNEETA